MHRSNALGLSQGGKSKNVVVLLLFRALRPWGGAVDGMLTFALGNTVGVPLVDPLLVRQEQRSSESNLWLMPNTNIFCHKKAMVIPLMPRTLHTTSRSFKTTSDAYKTRVLPLMDQSSPPGAPVTCVDWKWG